MHGQGTDKYDNVRIGLNGRLDTLQAAILLEKLRIFPDELERRVSVARRYSELLRDVVMTPSVPAGVVSAWAQYTIRLDRRDEVAERLAQQGIPTAIYYPRPLHRQTAYQRFPRVPSLERSERASREVLSLPMHPYLEPSTQDRITEAIAQALR